MYSVAALCFRQSEGAFELNRGEAWVSGVVASFAYCRVMCRHFVHISHVSSRAFENSFDHSGEDWSSLSCLRRYVLNWFRVTKPLLHFIFLIFLLLNALTQPDEYRGILHALWRIIREEGFLELYRGLAPSIIGVIPYAGVNYYAYDSLRSLYKRLSKEERIGNIQTLLIGSLAGAIASSSTFPLEVARKQMQVGIFSKRMLKWLMLTSTCN